MRCWPLFNNLSFVVSSVFEMLLKLKLREGVDSGPPDTLFCCVLLAMCEVVTTKDLISCVLWGRV